MHERREVERSEENPPRWYWRDGETDTNNETEESSDSEDDSKLSSSGIDTGSESPSARSEVSQKPVSRFSDDFDLIEKLGEGGYGRVYKVKGKLAEVLYAVKVVEYDRYALREVKALASFQHPNIVRYYAAWPELSDLQASTASPASTESTYESEDEEDQSESSGAIMTSNKDKYLYIQMEFCKGGNLKQWICEKNEGNMQSRDDALMIFQQIVQGVEYIHLQGHIHRDLKPENILFGNDNKVKIGDLGLVTVISEEGSNSVKRTKQKGTPSYMSPEQQENLRTYDEKVDIYPLGLICFELLWEMRTGMERSRLLENLRERIFPPEFVRQYSSEHKLIKKMLSKAPDKRPAASAIAQGLRVLMEEHDGLGDLKTV
ncbi:hypothetical protein MATL_G00189050 [Megalops atlanticus]|uniref:non-specific serine/threonine protein kinase n=1 Tax=Megalops atlanticus TaxID=7932 RepID=A0A9D3PNA9_MEGAT|nr:hypothetical protein MATL_G00189050 [Megalops atlanticus]